MSDHFPDSENDNLSGDIDITGSSSTNTSLSLDMSGEVKQEARTPDYISDISNIPSPIRLAVPTSPVREGAGRLEQILRMGSGTQPNQAFIEELNGDAQAQSTLVVDLTAGEDKVSKQTASQASTSTREGSESSKSTTLAGEPIQSRQRGRHRPLCINGLRVYRMVNMEMVDLAGDRLVYTVDYFTSAVTSQYLESFREEFEIPNDVQMIVSGPNDLPSRPLPGFITLFTEFFRAGQRLPFHPFL